MSRINKQLKGTFNFHLVIALKGVRWGDGSMASALADLAEDPGFIPSTHTGAHNGEYPKIL